ncbi:hypothetical protein N7510_008714 [Penicillium lagena]|uniref:uncharacterized protein n=1 Tax=Penicillium lagena TaxID=94218 RepID=UPI00253FB0D3|nr:uncharacterized protein N7510_008714 [Penicillium lagena]KAJ5605933.1 hypothetical protein N7510_008714 [Penicillium lagena]
MLGWDAYRRFDMFTLRPGEITKQFSSYDRTNGNNDGSYGTYSCLYNSTDGRCVIADAKGPGEIASIWFTYENDSVVPIGDIRIELDSHLVLQHDLQSLVNGDIGAPFVWPLVGNTNDTNGGNVIKVPMPYTKSMIISTLHNPHYYHVVYRELPADANVNIFDPKDSALDALDTSRRFGVVDPKCRSRVSSCPYSPRRTRSESHAFTVDSGNSSQVATISGSGIVTQLQLRVPEILGAPHVEDDGRAYGQGGWSSATFKLDPGSTQCQLTRRLDSTIGHQRAAVSVDGKDAGEWSDSGPSKNATWADQTLELKPELTANKRTINVKSTFIASDLDFNEFFYAVHCKLNDTSDWELMDLLNVGPNNPHDEATHDYEISGQTWSGVRHYLYEGDRLEQATRSLQLISDLYLKLTFDGQTTADGPIGSFFGSALGKFAVRSLMLSIDTLSENGAFTSWWPMPFNNSVVVELVNHAGAPVQGSIDLKWAPWSAPPAPWGYFATQHHHAETKTGVLWNFLSETGRGVACGVTQAFRGAILPPNNTLDFLEGDLKVWTNRDGKTGPFDQATMLGTGTEDFYESGWYFTDAQDGTYGSTAVPFAMPLTGMEAHEFRELNCIGECLEASRLMLADSMNFDDGISFNIEHGPVNNDVNANYETTAFYYLARHYE